MRSILQSLEPIEYKKGEYIAQELDEFGEVTFIQNGSVAIGFEINKVKQFCLRPNLMNCVVVGGYGVTFNQRSTFIYLAAYKCKGYFIRKANWMKILEDNPDISKQIRQNILIDFIVNIRSKVNVQKNRAI
jgi:hypothetical protein